MGIKAKTGTRSAGRLDRRRTLAAGQGVPAGAGGIAAREVDWLSADLKVHFADEKEARRIGWPEGNAGLRRMVAARVRRSAACPPTRTPWWKASARDGLGYPTSSRPAVAAGASRKNAPAARACPALRPYTPLAEVERAVAGCAGRHRLGPAGEPAGGGQPGSQARPGVKTHYSPLLEPQAARL